MDKEFKNYGTFKVSTKTGSCGRELRELGIFEGYIDEIALALADKCYYTLYFEPYVIKTLDMTPKKDSVRISLPPVVGMPRLEANKYLKDFFADHNVEVLGTDDYGVCTISIAHTVEERRKKALSKLTYEEKKLLGLVD